MDLDDALLEAIGEARAVVRVGYPWWLRPWLAQGVIAITLGRRIYISTAMEGRPAEAFRRLLRHELMHVRQVEQLGLIRFLWRYGWEFVRHFRRVRSVDRAYRMISFEVEAYAAEHHETGSEAPQTV